MHGSIMCLPEVMTELNGRLSLLMVGIDLDLASMKNKSHSVRSREKLTDILYAYM